MAKKATGAQRRSSKSQTTRKAKRSTSPTTSSTARDRSHESHAKAAQRGRPKQSAHPDERPASQSESATGALQATAEAVGRGIGRATAVIGQHLPWKGKEDGLTLLERDHRLLESLLKQADETDEGSGTRRKDVLARIARELKAHELMEEKVLYPALKSHSEAKDIVLEGYQEHHVADLVMKELQKMPPSDERWGAKLTVLKENIEHHIEEEEGEMFKTARSIFSEEQLQALGAEMQELKARALPETERD